MNKRDREPVDKTAEVLIDDIGHNNRSPDAKKGRRDVERMETWKGSAKDNNEKELIAVTIVANELVSNTSNGKVKSLIDCYNPLIREETDLMKEHIITCCKGWDNKEEILREAIRYVWPEIDIGIDRIEDFEKLVDVLLLSIETLMPKHCKECDDHYIVGRGDKPVIRCMWCKGGAHDCIDRGNKEKLRGMFWLCRVCNDIVIRQILPKIDIVKKMELAKKEIEINFEGFETKKDNNNNVEEENQGDINNEDISQDSKGVAAKKDDENIAQGGKGEKDTGNDNTKERNSRIDNKKNERICWFYENRTCKFGSQCRNAHPEACKQMLEYGKCPNSYCKLFHPKICRELYDHGLCRRSNCWYIHPTKIANRNGMYHSNNNNNNDNNQNNSRNGNSYPNQSFQNNPRNSNNNSFLGIWPTPAETSTNMHNTLARLIGTLEKVDARIENLEMRQMNRWNY